MIYQATRKIAGGKLVRVKIVAEETIESVQISGDFFLHPEDILPLIEQQLVGMSVHSSAQLFANKIDAVLNMDKAFFVGVSPLDIAEMIVEAIARK